MDWFYVMMYTYRGWQVSYSLHQFVHADITILPSQSFHANLTPSVENMTRHVNENTWTDSSLTHIPHIKTTDPYPRCYADWHLTT